MAGRTNTTGAGAAAPPIKHQHDPVQWMRYYWEQQNQGDPTVFLAMTSVLRLHHLMTTTLDGRLKAKFKISLTDYQILIALHLSDNGTWLLSRLAWHLMVHATTVTLAVDRLETKQLVKRHSHPNDRRATLVSISDQGRALADEATRSLSRLDFGLPGLAPSQARSLTATIARVRTGAGDLDRSYGPAPNRHA